MADDTVLGTGLHAVVDRALRGLEFVAMCIATIFLLTMMALMSLDAILRYTMNSPLVFQLTLTEDYLLVGVTMMALSWGFRTGGYIRISGLAEALPAQVRGAVLRLGLLASAGYASVLCWQSWSHFWSAFMSGAVKFGVLDYPVWLSHVWVPTGLGLLSLRLLLTATGPNENLTHDHDMAEEQ